MTTSSGGTAETKRRRGWVVQGRRKSQRVIRWSFEFIKMMREADCGWKYVLACASPIWNLGRSSWSFKATLEVSWYRIRAGREGRGYEAKKSGYTKIGQENESYNKNIRCWTNLKERSGFAFSDTWKVCLIDKWEVGPWLWSWTTTHNWEEE